MASHDEWRVEESSRDPNSVRAVCNDCGWAGKWRQKRAFGAHKLLLNHDHAEHQEEKEGS